MNLRDEDQRGAVQLFPLTGVASIRQIADTLLVPHDEFSEMWNDLPLDDESIAARMGATRQQVINLRKSARERLERRLKELFMRNESAPVIAPGFCVIFFGEERMSIVSAGRIPGIPRTEKK